MLQWSQYFDFLSLKNRRAKNQLFVLSINIPDLKILCISLQQDFTVTRLYFNTIQLFKLTTELMIISLVLSTLHEISNTGTSFFPGYPKTRNGRSGSIKASYTMTSPENTRKWHLLQWNIMEVTVVGITYMYNYYQNGFLCSQTLIHMKSQIYGRLLIQLWPISE